MVPPRRKIEPVKSEITITDRHQFGKFVKAALENAKGRTLSAWSLEGALKTICDNLSRIFQEKRQVGLGNVRQQIKLFVGDPKRSNDPDDDARILAGALIGNFKSAANPSSGLEQG